MPRNKLSLGSHLIFSRVKLLFILSILCFTGCVEEKRLELDSKLLNQGNLHALTNFVNNISDQYANDSFAKETVICRLHYLFEINSSDQRLMRVYADFAQKGPKHNSVSDGADSNLRNVRRNRVVLDIDKNKASIPKGFLWNLDVALFDLIDESPMQGCRINLSVSKRPWQNFDPLKILLKADSMGGEKFRKKFCVSGKKCWAQIDEGGVVLYSQHYSTDLWAVAYLDGIEKFETKEYLGQEFY